MLFTNALVKENPVQEYGLYILVIPLTDKDDWRDADRHLLEAPSPESRVTIQLSEPGRINLVPRFPAPDRGRSRIEQAVLRRYLVAAATATNREDTE